MADVLAKLELSSFPIEEESLLAQYEKLYTALIYDVLRMEYGIYTVLPSNLVPLKDGMKVCGIAFTVKGMPDNRSRDEKPEEHEKRARMMEAMHKNSIVVWDTSHDSETAHFGEMMTATAMLRGSIGAIVDGGVRDTNQIMETGYKIWSRYRTPVSMYDRHEIVKWQTAIKIGEVTIRPGDVVFADSDGVIIIPRKIAYEVLQKAQELGKTEKGWREIIAAGVSPSEYIKKGGKL